MLEDERRSLRLRVTNNIQQLDNVDATPEVLKDLDFALDLLFVDRLP